MSIFILSQSIIKPEKFSWTGITESGKLTGGYGKTEEACKKEADKIGTMKDYWCGEMPEEPIELCDKCGNVRGIPIGINKCYCKRDKPCQS